MKGLLGLLGLPSRGRRDKNENRQLMICKMRTRPARGIWEMLYTKKGLMIQRLGPDKLPIAHMG